MDPELLSVMSKPPSGFERYRSRATRLIASPEDLTALSIKAANKLARNTPLSGRFQTVREELGLLVALLRAWINGDYRDVSTQSIVAIAAAVLYFVVPFDLIPDFIAGIGLLDDATVIAYVVSLVRDEIAGFQKWRSGVRSGSDEQKSPDTS